MQPATKTSERPTPPYEQKFAPAFSGYRPSLAVCRRALRSLCDQARRGETGTVELQIRNMNVPALYLEGRHPRNDVRAQRKGFIGGAFFKVKSLGYFLCACKESDAPARRNTNHQTEPKRPSALQVRRSNSPGDRAPTIPPRLTQYICSTHHRFFASKVWAQSTSGELTQRVDTGTVSMPINTWMCRLSTLKAGTRSNSPADRAPTIPPCLTQCICSTHHRFFASKVWAQSACGEWVRCGATPIIKPN